MKRMVKHLNEKLEKVMNVIFLKLGWEKKNLMSFINRIGKNFVKNIKLNS